MTIERVHEREWRIPFEDFEYENTTAGRTWDDVVTSNALTAKQTRISDNDRDREVREEISHSSTTMEVDRRILSLTNRVVDCVVSTDRSPNRRSSPVHDDCVQNLDSLSVHWF